MFLAEHRVQAEHFVAVLQDDAIEDLLRCRQNVSVSSIPLRCKPAVIALREHLDWRELVQLLLLFQGLHLIAFQNWRLVARNRVKDFGIKRILIMLLIFGSSKSLNNIASLLEPLVRLNHLLDVDYQVGLKIYESMLIILLVFQELLVRDLQAEICEAIIGHQRLPLDTASPHNVTHVHGSSVSGAIVESGIVGL